MSTGVHEFIHVSTFEEYFKSLSQIQNKHYTKEYVNVSFFERGQRLNDRGLY